MSKKHIVILVHGTFAIGADWTKTNSVLCRSLRKQVGEDIEFYRFNWQGRNKHEDRVAGSNRLRRHIAAIALKYPQAIIDIIGHSHGGNVIRYALQDEMTAQCISSVITLATPFVCCEKRKDMEYISIIIIVVLPIFFLTVIVPGLYWMIAKVFHLYFDKTEAYYFSGFAFLCSSLLSISMRKQISDFIQDWIWETQCRVKENVNGVHSVGVPFLCIRFTWDEAALGLSFSSIVSSVFSEYNKLVRNIFVWLIQNRLYAAMFGFILVAFFKMSKYSQDSSQDLPFNAFVFASLVFILIQIIVSVPLFILTYWVSWSSFGVKNMRFYDGLFSEITTRPTHPMLSNVELLEFSKSYALKKMGTWNALKFICSFGLSHSLAYANADALEFMSQWLKDSARRHNVPVGIRNG